MAETSTIEWTDATWNPVTGCTVLSPGCTHCYAMRLAGGRLRNHPSRVGLTKPGPNGPVWNGAVRFNEEWLFQPLRWRRRRMIFACAHGDLFEAAVPDEWIDRVFAVMALAREHTFQVLTKRPDRARSYINGALERVDNQVGRTFRDAPLSKDVRWSMHRRESSWLPLVPVWPLPNVWLGVSAENQAFANERIPILLDTPARVRFLSAEPLLGEIDLRRLHIPGPPERWLDALSGCHTGWARDGRLPPVTGELDWVIVGGESGPHARPMHPDWARSLRDQCALVTPFFFKQWGEFVPESQNPAALSELTAETALYVDATGDTRPAARGARNGATTVQRLGKKRAGRHLDGRTHDELPSRA